MRRLFVVLLLFASILSGQSQITYNDTTICEGDALQLGIDAPNAVSWSWSSGALLSCTDCPNPTTEPLFGPENFSVTATDSDGIEYTNDIFVNVQSYLDFGLLLFANSPVCEGDTLVFDPNVYGGQSYLWTGPGGFNSEDESPIITNVQAENAGTYTLDIIDGIGCEANAQFDVEIYPAMEVVMTTTSVSCENNCDAVITLDISGGTPPYEVSWDNGITWTNFLTWNGFCGGEYEVLIRDQNCETTESIFIPAPPAITANISILTIPYCDDSPAQIEISNISGGGGNEDIYYYSIDYGVTFQVVLDIPFFISEIPDWIVISDETGCTENFNLPIVQPEPLLADVQTTNASCVTMDGGTAFITVTGGTPPYEWVWEAPGIIDHLNLAPGNYTVEITDANGCEVTVEFEIGTSPIDFIGDDVTIIQGESTQLLATAADVVSVNWSPATGLNDPNVLSPFASPDVTTLYTLTVEDTEGCIGSEEILVTVVDPEVYEETYVDTLNIGTSDIWCSVVTILGAPIPFAVTEVVAGAGNLSLDIDTLNNCITYTGNTLGTDTVFVTICDQIDGSICFQSYLYLTVKEPGVWPGDTDTNGVVNNFDLLPIGLAYDTMGPIRPGATINWEEQTAPDWPQQTLSGINYKHIDTDGNGHINDQDTLAIIQNWGLEHNLMGEEEEIRILGNAPFYVQPDTLIEGATLDLPVILGDDSNQLENVYGVAFSLYYDPEMIEDGTAHFNMEPSWIGNPGTDAIYIQRNFDDLGRLDVGITRIDATNVSGEGQIGALVITVEDDILLRNGKGQVRSPDGVVFRIDNVRIISFEEEELFVTTPVTESPVIPVMTSTDESIIDHKVKLFPNPARGYFQIEADALMLEQVSLYSPNGKYIQQWQPNERGVYLLQGITPGLYTVKLQSREGVIWKKLTIH